MSKHLGVYIIHCCDIHFYDINCCAGDKIEKNEMGGACSADG
jgi:hypothetical protein